MALRRRKGVVDLPQIAGDQREKVIQYVYRRYGPHGAAMTANVITYRDRSASREVGKALGFSLEEVDRISKRLGGHASTEIREGARTVGAGVLAGCGDDGDDGGGADPFDGVVEYWFSGRIAGLDELLEIPSARETFAAMNDFQSQFVDISRSCGFFTEG